MSINDTNAPKERGFDNGQVTELPEVNENDLAQLSDQERLQRIRDRAKEEAVEEQKDQGFDNGQVTALPDATGTGLMPQADLAQDTPQLNADQLIGGGNQTEPAADEPVAEEAPANEGGNPSLPKLELPPVSKETLALIEAANNPANHPGMIKLRELIDGSDADDHLKATMHAIIGYALQQAQTSSDEEPVEEPDLDTLRQLEATSPAAADEPTAAADESAQVFAGVQSGDEAQHHLDRESGAEPAKQYVERTDLPSIPDAIEALAQALRNDPDYLWGWVANIAMPAQDQGLESIRANRAAANFLYNLTLNTNGEPVRAWELPQYQQLVQQAADARKAVDTQSLKELPDELTYKAAEARGFKIDPLEFDKAAKAYGQSGWMTEEQIKATFPQ